MTKLQRGTTLALVFGLLAVLGGCSQQGLAPEVTVQDGIESLPPFERAKTAVATGDLEFVKSCVEGDARYVEAYDDNGRTLLHIAAATDQIAIARYLIEKGARVNIDDSEGFLPFDAAQQEKASGAMMDLLKEAGMKEAGLQ